MIDLNKYVRVRHKPSKKVYRYYGIVYDTTPNELIPAGKSKEMAVYKINRDAVSSGGDTLLVMDLKSFNDQFEFC